MMFSSNSNGHFRNHNAESVNTSCLTSGQHQQRESDQHSAAADFGVKSGFLSLVLAEASESPQSLKAKPPTGCYEVSTVTSWQLCTCTVSRWLNTTECVTFLSESIWVKLLISRVIFIKQNMRTAYLFFFIASPPYFPCDEAFGDQALSNAA